MAKYPVVLVVTACLHAAAPAQQGARDLPASIRSALEQNAAALSPVTVEALQHYEMPGTWEETAARLRMFPKPPPSFFWSEMTRRWSWQDGLLYTKTVSSDSTRGTTEISFDGSILYVGRPEVRLPDGQKQPQLHRTNPARLDPGGQYLETEYFESAGFLLPAKAREFARGQEAQSRVLAALRDGGRLLRVSNSDADGVTVIRIDVSYPNPDRARAEEIDLQTLESEMRNGFNTEEYIQKELSALRAMRTLPERRVYSFDLDPALHYAVRRIEDRDENGALRTRVTNEGFAELDGRGLWLPGSSRTDYHTWVTIPDARTPEPLLSRVFEQRTLDGAPIPPEQFSLVYNEPGSVIADDVLTDEQIVVRAGVNGVPVRAGGRGSKPRETASVGDSDRSTGEDTLQTGTADEKRGLEGQRSAATGPASAPNEGGVTPRSSRLVWLGAAVVVLGGSWVVWRIRRR